MRPQITVHWFRQDLRLSDNPALFAAAQQGPVLPLYILDDESAGDHALGSASRCWLHHSLAALAQSLGGNLSLYRGPPEAVLGELATRYHITAVHWNRGAEPCRRRRDEKLQNWLNTQGITVESHNGSLLWDPWQITNASGAPYKVFTPFYHKGCLAAAPPRQPLPRPQAPDFRFDGEGSVDLQELSLLPPVPWHAPVLAHWEVGEDGAHRRFQQFLAEGLAHYKDGRNLPAKPYVSRLSPHLHFGEISPHQLWHAVRHLADDAQGEHFCRQLGWREFSHGLLYDNPDLPTTNLQAKFDAFPWVEDDVLLGAWQRGKTGVPLVDAGMRELWQTGYMHNRVRMIVGSFLVKNLRLHWRHGERWFWDTLLDADLANNSASWQWVAGCGADAAPYFRIFNPVTQAQRFDPEGDYIRRFVPEIADLPDKYLFSPWQAPAEVLRDAGVTLGDTYPMPVVDLKRSREAALAAFQSLSQNGSP